MTEEIILQIGQEALQTTALVAAPLLLGTLVIGVIVSIIQTLTQINEATLSFVPKLIVVAIILILAGPWMLDTMTSYTSNLIENISDIVRE